MGEDEIALDDEYMDECMIDYMEVQEKNSKVDVRNMMVEVESVYDVS